MAQFLCPSEDRREAVRRLTGPTPLNGIDFVEVMAGSPPQLELHLLHPLSFDLARENFAIEGGARIRELSVTAVSPATTTGHDAITLTVSSDGDRSTYTLRIVNPPPLAGVPAGIDPQLSAVDFVFHPECAGDFDCAAKDACPPPTFPIPQIDYLARDYSALRRQLLDRVSLLMPDWRERNAADVGVMLLELLAYAGDYLGYRQDAVATEGYLSTARRHTSVKRHGRLVDYQMHSGHNARAWVQIRVTSDVLGGALAAVPLKTRLLTDQPGLPPVPPAAWTGFADVVRAGAGVFETMFEVKDLFAAHNELRFHTWGATECCLPRGGTRGTLVGSHPDLSPGDVLVLAEARGPKTGDPADADTSHRQAVRLVSVDAAATDPFDGQLITEISWHADDRLTMPLCIASRDEKGNPVAGVSVAYGNIVLVDHGRTIGPPIEPDAQETLPAVPARGRYRPQLRVDPVTWATPPPPAPSAGVVAHSASAMFAADPRRALPAITLESTLTPPWEARLSMLERDIDGEARCFVGESEPGLGTSLRFGDGGHGRLPEPQLAFKARYRVGNGRAGNAGADSIHHILLNHPEIERVWNPLAAAGGVDPEAIEEARRKIPYAFRTQLRAVTAADYASEAMRVPGVQRAGARLRWTGSWYTVFVAIDPLGGNFTEDIRNRVHLALEQKRMAGHDIEVLPAALVPLAIEMHVCVARDHFREQVRSAILRKLTSGLQPDATPGLFHPDRIVMGERFYLSPLYAAAQSVDGVVDVRISRFGREGQSDQQGLIDGYLTPGVAEAFAIENDPNFPERGRFTLIVEGGV
jgi:Baseplate J-like protein